MTPAQCRAVAAQSLRVVPTARPAGGLKTASARSHDCAVLEDRNPRGERKASLIPWVGFDLKRDNRVSNACRQIADLVGDDQWHSWADIVTTVSAANGLQANTVSNLLYGMINTGSLCRRGTYRRRSRRDGRQIRRPA